MAPSLINLFDVIPLLRPETESLLKRIGELESYNKPPAFVLFLYYLSLWHGYNLYVNNIAI